MLPGVNSAGSVRRGPRYYSLGIKHGIRGVILTAGKAYGTVPIGATMELKRQQDVAWRALSSLSRGRGRCARANGADCRDTYVATYCCVLNLVRCDAHQDQEIEK